MHVLVESLWRFQQSLQGENPTAWKLWNEDRMNGQIVGGRPKDEGRLSDAIIDHFKLDLIDRGVVFNREVEIRRGTGGAKGERTDIKVDAVARQHDAAPFGTISVIVEVKGSWNAGLFTDMKSQLVDRYLRESHCRHGLYVVGWFNCDQWDDSKDGRKGKPIGYTDEKLDEYLKEQAVKFSVADLSIRAVLLNASLR